MFTVNNLNRFQFIIIFYTGQLKISRKIKSKILSPWLKGKEYIVKIRIFIKFILLTRIKRQDGVLIRKRSEALGIFSYIFNEMKFILKLLTGRSCMEFDFFSVYKQKL